MPHSRMYVVALADEAIEKLRVSRSCLELWRLGDELSPLVCSAVEAVVPTSATEIVDLFSVFQDPDAQLWKRSVPQPTRRSNDLTDWTIFDAIRSVITVAVEEEVLDRICKGAT